MTRTERLPVVYLAGSGHTGSTLLALFLDAHPEIASVGETAFRPKLHGPLGGNLAWTIRIDEHWRTSLSSEEQRAIAIAGPFGARHGYSLPS